MTNVINLDKERFKRRGILIDDVARSRIAVLLNAGSLSDLPNATLYRLDKGILGAGDE